MNGTLLASGNLSDGTTLARNNAANTFTANQAVNYSGADGTNPLVVNASSSAISGSPAVRILMPAAGEQNALSAGNSTDINSWFSLTNNANGFVGSSSSSGPIPTRPGVEFGPGGSTARDTFLYRSGAGVLTTPGSVAVGATSAATTISPTAGVSTPAVAAPTCTPLRGEILATDCGLVNSTALDQTVVLKAAIHAAQTAGAALFIPGNMTIQACNLTLDSTTDNVRVHGPMFGANSPAKLQATSACNSAGASIINGNTNSQRRSMQFDHITFDQNNAAQYAFYNNFAITWEIDHNSFVNCPAGGTVLSENAGEYEYWHHNYFQNSAGACQAYYGTNCNHCTSENNQIYTGGGPGSIGGYQFRSINDDVEVAFTNPYSSHAALWEANGYESTYEGGYVEVVGNSTCGLISGNITSGVGTIVTNCSMSPAAAGKFLSISGTHVIDANNQTIVSASTASGQTTVTWSTAASNATISSYNITSVSGCSYQPLLSYICTVVVSGEPTGLTNGDYYTMQGTGTCLDNNANQIWQVGPQANTFYIEACNIVTASTGTVVFGAAQAPYIGNPTYVYNAENYGDVNVLNNYFANDSKPANAGSYLIANANSGVVKGNLTIRTDGVVLPASSPSGLDVSANYADAAGPYATSTISMPSMLTSYGSNNNGLWSATSPSHMTVQGRNLLFGGAIGQTAVTVTGNLGVVDLRLGNIIYFNNTASTTVSTVYNASTLGKVIPGIYVFESANTNTTLASSAFTNACACNFTLPANIPVTYIVDYTGAVREVGTTSIVMSGAGNTNAYLNGAGAYTVPAGLIGNAIAKVAPTTTTSTSGVGATTLYTPTSAGQFRMCWYIDIIVAGTAGTYQGKETVTSDGNTYSAWVTAAVNANAQWNSTITGGSNQNACSTFYADASQPIKYQLNASSVTGTPTVRYAVTLEQLQ